MAGLGQVKRPRLRGPTVHSPRSAEGGAERTAAGCHLLYFTLLPCLLLLGSLGENEVQARKFLPVVQALEVILSRVRKIRSLKEDFNCDKGVIE
jgi:hypothetical protein